MNKKEKQNFNISLSVHQKYHAFRLAEGLSNNKLLKEFYTIYPKDKIGPYNIEKSKIKSFPLLGAFKYIGYHKLNADFLDVISLKIFDLLVASSLKSPEFKNEIFHGWNLSSYRSIKKANELGYTTAVERSCPHIDTQMEIIKKEMELLGVENKLTSKSKVKMMKKEYEVSDFIITPSSYTRKSFIDKGFDPKKVISVPLSLEKQTYTPKKERNYDDTIKVLFIGGNFYRKGLFYLLKAWESLSPSNAELIIKGSIPDKFNYLKNTKGVSVIDKYLKEEELKKLYKNSHIFVLPSIDEGFGMVVAEAMTAGLPVIVTENVGAADNVKDGKEGFVVPIRSPKDIADKLDYLLSNPNKIKEMSKNAIKKSDFFAPESYINRMIKAYNNMLNNE